MCLMTPELQAAEDKTFGLKNKSKSSKVQKCVHVMQHFQQPLAVMLAAALVSHL